MRFNSAIAPALCASVLFAGNALAHEEVEPVSSAAVERPTFTVSLPDSLILKTQD